MSRIILFAASALLAAVTAWPALAQSDLLALNAVASERIGPTEWRLTLTFGRADRSPNASARSVNAPALGEGQIVLQTGDGLAAPFIIHAIAAPNGPDIRLRAEYFAAGTPPEGYEFQVAIVGEARIDPERSVVPFALIAPGVEAEIIEVGDDELEELDVDNSETYDRDPDDIAVDENAPG